jgi:hypothetical protein
VVSLIISKSTARLRIGADGNIRGATSFDDAVMTKPSKISLRHHHHNSATAAEMTLPIWPMLDAVKKCIGALFFNAITDRRGQAKRVIQMSSAPFSLHHSVDNTSAYA